MRIVILVLLLCSSARADLRTLTMPSITGLTTDQANAKLKQVGFLYAVTDADASTACADPKGLKDGAIQCQDPAPGAKALENKMIMIRIYRAPPVTLSGRALLGLTVDEAKKKLASLGFDGFIQTQAVDGSQLLSDERKLPACAPTKVCDTVPWEFGLHENLTLQYLPKTEIHVPE